MLARHSNPKVREQGIALLSGPECPEELDYLWLWFLEISAGRGEGMNGEASLSYASIDAWSRLTDTEIAPHEVHAIFALDFISRHPEGE